MTDQIYSFNKSEFPFNDITLANPRGLQGGAYFSKIKLLGNSISLQTPKCITKNGIIKTDKKIYCDLMFNKDDEGVVDFITELEDKIKQLIYEKKDKWFHSEMDMDTIDYHWQNILRTYKGTNVLLRCFIKKPKNTLQSNSTIEIYDEEENQIDLDKVTKDKSIMTLLDLTGLKFTSQSFSIDFNLTQVMVLKDRVIKNKCLIKRETLVKEPVNQIQPNKEKQEKQDATPTLEEKTFIIESNNQEDGEEDDDTTENNNIEVGQDNLENTSENTSEDVKPDLIENAETTEDETLEKPTDDIEEFELNEINLELPENSDSVTLKQPNEVYLEIYKEVKKRAKEAKKKAIAAYLEAKRIRSLYLLDEIESSDDESELLAMKNDL
jgi:hypothetical protein